MILMNFKEPEFNSTAANNSVGLTVVFLYTPKCQ